MKTKKYVITLAIVLGALFTAQATNLIDLNEQQKTGVDKSKLKIRKHG